MNAVRKAFRPEFINRLDEIILFARLARENMVHIVDIQLRHLEKRLEERHISLQLDDKAKQWLADAGYDPAYGARPLKRVIQRSLQDKLASLILAGTVPDGSKVMVSADGEGLMISNSKAKTKVA